MADNLHKQVEHAILQPVKLQEKTALLVRCICLMLELKLTFSIASPPLCLMLTLSASHGICTAMPAQHKGIKCHSCFAQHSGCVRYASSCDFNLQLTLPQALMHIRLIP